MLKQKQDRLRIYYTIRENVIKSNFPKNLNEKGRQRED
jgi:hypothetical protein